MSESQPRLDLYLTIIEALKYHDGSREPERKLTVDLGQAARQHDLPGVKDYDRLKSIVDTLAAISVDRSKGDVYAVGLGLWSDKRRPFGAGKYQPTIFVSGNKPVSDALAQHYQNVWRKMQKIQGLLRDVSPDLANSSPTSPERMEKPGKKDQLLAAEDDLLYAIVEYSLDKIRARSEKYRSVFQKIVSEKEKKGDWANKGIGNSLVGVSEMLGKLEQIWVIMKDAEKEGNVGKKKIAQLAADHLRYKQSRIEFLMGGDFHDRFDNWVAAASREFKMYEEGASEGQAPPGKSRNFNAERYLRKIFAPIQSFRVLIKFARSWGLREILAEDLKVELLLPTTVNVQATTKEEIKGLIASALNNHVRLEEDGIEVQMSSEAIKELIEKVLTMETDKTTGGGVKKPLHYECTLLKYAHNAMVFIRQGDTGSQKPRLYGYFGVSKLCCVGCALLFEVYNELADHKFLVKGSHQATYGRIIFPTFEDRDFDERVYSRLERKLQKEVVRLLREQGKVKAKLKERRQSESTYGSGPGHPGEQYGNEPAPMTWSGLDELKRKFKAMKPT